MGEHAELRARETAHIGVRVIPPDDDEYVAVRATDLIGRVMVHDTLGRAVGRRDGGFVVIDYPDAGEFHRTHIRDDAWVRVKRG